MRCIWQGKQRTPFSLLLALSTKNGTSPVLQSTAPGLLIQPDRLPISWLSQCVNSAWVIPDILQSSMLTLVTTRLKYMAEHECVRRGHPDMSELEETDELNKNTKR